MRLVPLAVSISAAVLLAGCGGSGSGFGTPVPPINQSAAVVSVPGLASTANFSFDLGTVVDGKYYLTDRNNKAVDVVDTTSLQIAQIKGTGANAFTGVSAGGNAVSGPNGINDITGTTMLFVGDVDSVKVVDKTSNTVTSTIKVGTTGFRADEGCYDPVDHLYMISTPDAPTPFASFIDANTLKLVATVVWLDIDGATPAGGNEQCQYDAGTQSFIVNNDATIANPHGEMEMIPVVSIRSIPAGGSANVFSLANVKRFPLGNCDPTGLALGPSTDAMAECRQGDAGAALTTLIVNRTNGAIVATIPFGGGDQVAFDARTNQYYIAASRWHASGKNDQGGGCSASNPCTPTLGIVDASTRKLVKTLVTGNNAHSVAVDPLSGEVFVPFSSAASPAGCPTCAANGFNAPGISVFAL
jgi:hypothetical protein